MGWIYDYFVWGKGEAVSFSYDGFRVVQHDTDPYWVHRLSGDLNDFRVMASAVVRFYKFNPLIIDIGANIGLVSLSFRKVPGSHIEAFEPVRRTFEFLKMNIERNGLSNVRIHNMGLSDAACEQVIGAATPENDSGSFMVLDGQDIEETGDTYTESAKFDTLDSVVESLDLKRVDYIKIDTEGHDARVLKGCRHVIERFSPVIQIEISTNARRSKAEDLDFFLGFIKSGDYEVYQIYDGNLKIDDLVIFFGQSVIQNDIILMPASRT